MRQRLNISKESTLAKEVFRCDLSDFPLKQGEYILELRKVRQSRSIKQNRMYWGYVLTIISLHTGYEADELHEFFKSLREQKEVTISKTTIEIPVSTTKLNTKEFTEYIDRVRQWCWHNLNLDIPEPKDDEDIKSMEAHYKNRYY